jgi:hypothetical protein
VDEKPRIEFWFEWTVLTGPNDNPCCFWPRNDAARKLFFGGPIGPEKLGLSEELGQRARILSEWYQGSLDWGYPPDPGPWRQEECDRFNAAVQSFFEDVVAEVGDRFNIVNTQRIMVEDPRLGSHPKPADSQDSSANTPKSVE